jgi:hypothetical protein
MNISDAMVAFIPGGELMVKCRKCQCDITTYDPPTPVYELPLTEVISLVDEHECEPVREHQSEGGK